MRQRRLLAALALLAATGAARAEHFTFDLQLQGTYSLGGTDGCTPPDFDQPACPRSGALSGHLSFDTPANGDGSWSVTGDFGDITDFSVDLGGFASDVLIGAVNVHGHAPNGFVQASDASEMFDFDWATHTASFTYDYGYHAPNGSFTGVMLAAVPEPAPALLMLAGLLAVAGVRRRSAR